jgi:hypothetical protein
MRRIGVVLILALASQASADVQVATSAKITPGTYAAHGFDTRFDGEGHWVTSQGGQALLKGRYVLDGDVLLFTSTPGVCADERVRYRVRFDAKGFHLKFLDDSCKRGGIDITFVRARPAQQRAAD